MLFGAPLKGASRPQLREVFRAHGLAPIREDDQYWYDEYNPTSVLEGASSLAVGYVAATHKFAVAEYKFSGTMDTQLVARVINLIESKYGAPSSRSGNINLGDVLATWNFPNGMKITVSRDWPDTTTFLDYVDVTANTAMQAEIDAEKQRQAKEKASSESSAF
ncbi:hypothetical protein GCM10007863_45470 [Dyella mobilis]|nr:hypothetical protein GCM10007863_45470 [Dyella mobilis]